MSRLLPLLLILALAATAGASGSTHDAPVKAAIDRPAPPPDPARIRQGGDTIETAVFLAYPAVDVTGTTIGCTDDYDEVCPYVGSTSPDVVYRLAPPVDVAVDIDMFGSTYDTKIYVYDAGFDLVACNDDWYPDYVSKLENVVLAGDEKYYLVIDGYGGDAGEYVLNIGEHEPCQLECLPGSELEGEPALMDGYEDWYNGGCDSPEYGNPFGTITSWSFCGRTGWYIDPTGISTHDTDWFEILIPDDGFVAIVGDAEYETFLAEVGPQDCDDVALIQNVTIGPCAEGELVVVGQPWSTVWIRVAPAADAGPSMEYDYTLLLDITVRARPTSWSAVKGMFD